MEHPGSQGGEDGPEDAPEEPSTETPVATNAENTLVRSVESLSLQEGAQQPTPLHNQGHGAGGAQTVRNGAAFEADCSVEPQLEAYGFHRLHWGKPRFKTHYCWQRRVPLPDNAPPRVEMYFTQGGLGQFIKKSREYKSSIDADPTQCLLWSPSKNYEYRSENKPDAAFLIVEHTDDVSLSIIEMKTQNGSGSVDIKLLAGTNFRRTYEIDFPDWYVQYAFCVQGYLEKQYDKNWKHIKTLLKDDNIPCYKRSDPNVQTTMLDWVGIYPPAS